MLAVAAVMHACVAQQWAVRLDVALAAVASPSWQASWDTVGEPDGRWLISKVELSYAGTVASSTLTQCVEREECSNCNQWQTVNMALPLTSALTYFALASGPPAAGAFDVRLTMSGWESDGCTVVR